MPSLTPVRVLFDEYHSESWTISLARAREMNPDESNNSSYSQAAALLDKGEFVLNRNVSAPLSAESLKDADILVLIHPCDTRWELTTSSNSPMLDEAEINSIVDFVRGGGGLLVISEYENDKYGNNLNALLRHFGLGIQNTTLTDKENAVDSNRTWVALSPETDADQPAVTEYVRKICYFRGGSCDILEAAEARPAPLLRSSSTARPKSGVAAAYSQMGQGRVVLVADSDLFGDDYIADARFDHSQLWLNIFYWLGERVFTTPSTAEAAVADTQDGFSQLAASINRLRELQEPSGAKSASSSAADVDGAFSDVIAAVERLRGEFTHQSDYFSAMVEDLNRWRDGGYDKPDFEHSLSRLNIERIDDKDYVVVFPMYLQNASNEIKFDSILMRIVWPPWLAEYERTNWPNPAFITADIKRYSDGYDSECAVFFPEMVAGFKKIPTKFGVIFRNREAARFQKTSLKAAKTLRLKATPQMWCFLNNLGLIENAFSFWDLIHDTTHQRGPLPRVLFKEKGRRPYWMHALEELRVDLGSWVGAYDLYKSKGVAMGIYVCWCVLFDRIFRFPITGGRVKNYDSLAGQILTNALLDNQAMIWENGVLSFDWNAADAAVRKLRGEINDFERQALRSQKEQNWTRAYDLIAGYVPPSISSTFKSNPISACVYDKKKDNYATVLDDEFPLSDFHTMLKQQISK
ncbi:MAG TPA: DUF6421 family protein [Pyrinomonadaceae bacterium]